MTEFNDINLPADFDDLSKYAPMLESWGKGDGFVVPENYFSEAKELSLAACHLSLATDKGEGFTVPENYFEELAERIISISQLMALKKDSPFSIPENYFETLTDKIVSNATLSSLKDSESFEVPENYFEKLTDEIVSIANLASLKNSEAFEVPEGYFSQLDETLNTTIALDNLKQDEGFTVPEGYFEKVSDSILSRIAVEELNTGSDADVPAGYFDRLADRIANRIAQEENVDKEETVERGRVIVFAEVLKRYARPVSIAASIALIIGVSIWFFNRSNNENGAESGIAKVEIKHNQPIQNPISPVKKDAVVAPQQIAVNNNSSKPFKHKSHKPVNLSQDQVVKVEKKDVMDQVDLLDVSTIADFVDAQGTTTKSQDDKILNESMKEYLLNDDADPSLIINNEKDQQ